MLTCFDSMKLCVLDRYRAHLTALCVNDASVSSGRTEEIFKVEEMWKILEELNGASIPLEPMVDEL